MRGKILVYLLCLCIICNAGCAKKNTLQPEQGTENSSSDNPVQGDRKATVASGTAVGAIAGGGIGALVGGIIAGKKGAKAGAVIGGVIGTIVGSIYGLFTADKKEEYLREQQRLGTLLAEIEKDNLAVTERNKKISDEIVKLQSEYAKLKDKNYTARQRRAGELKNQVQSLKAELDATNEIIQKNADKIREIEGTPVSGIDETMKESTGDPVLDNIIKLTSAQRAQNIEHQAQKTTNTDELALLEQQIVNL